MSAKTSHFVQVCDQGTDLDLLDTVIKTKDALLANGKIANRGFNCKLICAVEAINILERAKNLSSFERIDVIPMNYSLLKCSKKITGGKVGEALETPETPETAENPDPTATSETGIEVPLTALFTLANLMSSLCKSSELSYRMIVSE